MWIHDSCTDWTILNGTLLEFGSNSTNLINEKNFQFNLLTLFFLNEEEVERQNVDLATILRP